MVGFRALILTIVAIVAFCALGVLSYLASGSDRAPIIATSQSSALPPSPEGIPGGEVGPGNFHSGPIDIHIDPIPLPQIAVGASTARTPAGLAPHDPEQDCRDRMRRLGVVSSGPCIDVGDIVNNLATGTYAFNKPASANVGTSFRLVLTLKTSPTQDVSKAFSGAPGAVNEEQGKFAQSLEATLHGDDFEIDPRGAQSRTATLNDPVKWEWKVTPQSGGKKMLVVDVAANIRAGPDLDNVQIKTLEEPIVIEVSAFQQIKIYMAAINGYVLALSGTLAAIGAIIGFVAPVRRFVFGRKGQTGDIT